MNKSKPGNKLSPELKAVVEPIYRRDPKRYARLILFIWQSQKAGYSDEVIADAFKAADKYLDLISNWWPYMVKSLKQKHTRGFQKEAEGYKKNLGFTSIGQVFDQFANDRSQKSIRRLSKVQ